MKTISIPAALAALTGVCVANYADWDKVVTETVSRTHYICPCLPSQAPAPANTGATQPFPPMPWGAQKRQEAGDWNDWSSGYNFESATATTTSTWGWAVPSVSDKHTVSPKPTGGNEYEVPLTAKLNTVVDHLTAELPKPKPTGKCSTCTDEAEVAPTSKGHNAATPSEMHAAPSKSDEAEVAPTSKGHNAATPSGMHAAPSKSDEPEVEATSKGHNAATPSGMHAAPSKTDEAEVEATSKGHNAATPSEMHGAPSKTDEAGVEATFKAHVTLIPSNGHAAAAESTSKHSTWTDEAEVEATSKAHYTAVPSSNHAAAAMSTSKCSTSSTGAKVLATSKAYSTSASPTVHSAKAMSTSKCSTSEKDAAAATTSTVNAMTPTWTPTSEDKPEGTWEAWTGEPGSTGDADGESSTIDNDSPQSGDASVLDGVAPGSLLGGVVPGSLLGGLVRRSILDGIVPGSALNGVAPGSVLGGVVPDEAAVSVSPPRSQNSRLTITSSCKSQKRKSPSLVFATAAGRSYPRRRLVKGEGVW
jgi:hypothetical protein